MSQNPEEGRFTPETKAEAIREARKRTVEMRRQLRAAKHKKEAEKKAARWLERHAPKREEVQEQMHKVSYGRAPLNRRGRRYYAKKMNAFKTPQGWKNFNAGYAEKYGHMESVSRGNRARKDAIKAAKAKNRSNSINLAIKKGDK